MPIKLDGTTLFDESNFADKDLSNLTATGSAALMSAVNDAVSELGVMKRPNYANASQKTLSCTCTVNKTSVSNISYTSFTLSASGYLTITSLTTAFSSTGQVSNHQIKINNKLVPNDVLTNSLVPVSTNDVVTITATITAGSTGFGSSSNTQTFTIAEFMFYPEHTN